MSLIVKLTEAGSNRSWGTLGQMLKERYGRNVYSIATNFNQGSFIATEVLPDSITRTTVTLGPAPEDTFSYLLAQTGMEVFFIDFRGIRDQRLLSWLNSNRAKLRYSGAVFLPTSQFMPYLLTKNFDGLIFVNTINELTLDLN